MVVSEACGEVAHSLPEKNLETAIYPIVHTLCSDKSWRVRYMVADKFCEVSDLIWVPMCFIYLG